MQFVETILKSDVISLASVQLISIGNRMVSRGIWHKYHKWYFKIVFNVMSHFGKWYIKDNFEISLFISIYAKYCIP